MNMNGAPSSDPWTYVSHEVSVDPVDAPRVDISERGQANRFSYHRHHRRGTPSHHSFPSVL